jgi:hypothetical protein
MQVIMSNMATSYKLKAQADRQEQERVTAAAEEGIERGGDSVDRLEPEAPSPSRVQIDTEADSEGGSARAACIESRGGAACLVSGGVQSREPPEHTSHSPSLSGKGPCSFISNSLFLERSFLSVASLFRRALFF